MVRVYFDMPSPSCLIRCARRLVAGCALAVVAASGAPVAAQGPRTPAAPGDTLRLSMAEAVERALRASDEARIAEAQADAADAQAEIARATALPQLRLNTAYTHVYENARAQAVGSIFNQPNTYNVNANLSQPLFQGGRAVAAIRAARRRGRRPPRARPGRAAARGSR